MSSRNADALAEEAPDNPGSERYPVPRGNLLPVLPPRPTNREIHQQVWRIAWPSVITMMLQTVNSLMDTFFVGHLPNGAEALAATGVGGSVIFLLVSFAMGISVGTVALVSRFTGAEDPDNAILATGQSLSLSAIMGLVLGLLVLVFREPLVGLMLSSDRSPIAAHLCSQFLQIALLASAPLFVGNVILSAFRGIGDTQTPLRITLVTVATHIFCNWLFIYGNLGAPRLGVAGGGLALAISLCLSMILLMVALFRKTYLREAFRWINLRPRLEWMERILRIGIPASIQAVIRTLSMMSFTGMLARTTEGAAGVAALQIGIRAESIAFMPGFGYSVAASALVGQSLGAKDPERAERCGYAATWQAVGVMSVFGVLFLVFAQLLPHLFTGDPTVIALSTSYLMINAFGEPFLALGMVLTGALQGAGDTIRPTYITFLTMWVLRMPLAWWLMFSVGLQTRGAWITMLTSTLLGGFMTLALFRSGKWKRLKV